MNKQGKNGIEWCDYTWSPVTGCLHGCNYCYARKIAIRFGRNSVYEEGKTYELNHPYTYDIEHGWDSMGNPIIRDFIDPYPYGFAPTFHRYRLDEPQKLKKPSKIFVVSMGDLFGAWVPDEWIEEVFKACKAAPQHKYLFLTKNQARYADLGYEQPENYWFGNTITSLEFSIDNRLPSYTDCSRMNRFLSLEPLLGEVKYIPQYVKWVIIGQQTGPGATPPKDEWVQSIIDQCRASGVPVFIKHPLYEKFPIQELPEGLKEVKHDG